MKFVLQQQGKVQLTALALAMGGGLFCSPMMSGAEPAVALAAQPGEQAVQIQGTVVDNTGEPVIGASVQFPGPGGKMQGVNTDIDGNFSIRCVPGTKLTITYIGYTTQTVPAAQGMTITMTEEASMLEGIEVVAYGVQKKVTMTGAISSVKSDDLIRTPVSSVNNVLAGQLSGVTTVQYSGEPGSDAANIFVRGQATWVDSAPLVQVDGVEREMWDVDPNEIESITVLKDASATAVFGVRGANGVILITTKRGAEGKANISVNLSFSALQPTKLVEQANSYEYANFYNQMRANDGNGPAFSESIIEKFRTGSDPYRFPSTRWTDYVLKKTTLQQQHNVNISGGNDKVKYFISAGMFTQGGLFKQFGKDYNFDYRYQRFNYRANVDINATKTTTVSVNVSGKIDDSCKPRTGQGSSGMIKAIYEATPFSSYGFDEQGRYIYSNNAADYNTWTDEDGKAHTEVLPHVGGSPMTYIINQPGAYQYNNNKMMIDLIINQKLDFITKNLSLKLKGSYNSLYGVTKTLDAATASYTPVLQADQSLLFLKNGQDADPKYSYDTGRARDWYMEGSLNWNRSFGKNNITALVLYNQSKTYYPKTYSDIPRTYVGLVGRVTYDFDNKYMAEFNFGYNGSENFAPGKRFGSFPAGSVGWVVSSENFWEPLRNAVSFLKLRASWGLVGNDKVGASRFMYLSDPYVVNGQALMHRTGSDANAFAYYFGNGEAAATQWGAVEYAKNNPNVTWEKAFKQDYGFDLNFLNNRLMTTFDYYREHRTDILWQDNTTPTMLGFTPPYTNFGIVDSWGWEVSLNWNDKVGKDFLYWGKLNLSYNQNKIIEDRQAPQTEEYMYTAGRRIGSRSQYKFWGYYYDGCEADYMAKTGQEQFPSQLVPNLKPGDCVYVDLNGDGKIDSNDMSRDLGKTDDPQYILGITLGCSWKGLSFNAQFTSAWDMTRVISGAFREPFYNSARTQQGGLLSYHFKDSWSPENTHAEYPRPTVTNMTQNYAESTLWEKDASYFRCKTMQVAYDFRMPWMKKVGLTQLQLSVSAYNLFTITSYKWGDPENRASTAPSYPLQRTYTAGLKVAF